MKTEVHQISTEAEATEIIEQLRGNNSLRYRHPTDEPNKEFRPQFLTRCIIPETSLEYRTHMNGEIVYWTEEKLRALLVKGDGAAELMDPEKVTLKLN